MPDVCTQHDLLMSQILELGNQISHVKTTLLRAIIAMFSASSAMTGIVLAVI